MTPESATLEQKEEMSNHDAESQMPAYSEAVKSGLYAKQSGLKGKYDNVRRYWEDEVTRLMITPHLQKVMEYCDAKLRRLRVLDLGCGSADGYELITGMRLKDSNLHDTEVRLAPPHSLGLYRGVDLSADLLAQGASIYGGNPKVQFLKADFTQGLPVSKDEELFDFYFSSFGTSSHHNDDSTIINLLAEIAERTQEYAVVVCDWLGRYSYEWQELWTDNLEENKNMDYVVSYIYEKEERERRRDELQHLLLRLMSRPEAESIVEAASKKSGVPIKALSFFDRSILTGRHIDTGDYNPGPQPIREAVNSLHEANVRTDFSQLYFDFVPKPGMGFINRYFEKVQMCWNKLVSYTDLALNAYDESKARFEGDLPPVAATYPEPLRVTMNRMHQVVESVGWYKIGLPRENIIEPQLGYALRHLVTQLQEGQGCSHGLVAVLEIDKR